MFEGTILNESKVNVFSERLFLKEHLANSVKITAFVKEYALVSSAEKSSILNHSIVNIEAFTYGGSTHQTKLVEIDGRVLNESVVKANAELVWLRGDVINKAVVNYSTKIQMECFQSRPHHHLYSS